MGREEGGEGIDEDEGGLPSSPSASLFLNLLNLSNFDRLSKEARKCLLPLRLLMCL